MTPFEKRIAKRIRKFGEVVTEIELSEICKNVYKTVGEFPTNLEIDFEVEAYYFDAEEVLKDLKSIAGIEFGTLGF